MFKMNFIVKRGLYYHYEDSTGNTIIPNRRPDAILMCIFFDTLL